MKVFPPTVAAFLAFASTLAAQDPEVRRALPVGTPDPVSFENPDWMNRLSVSPDGGVEVRRALPANAAEVPAATPAPDPEPVPEPQFDREGGNEAIRIAPGGGGVGPLERADSLHARGMYDLAIPEYERFLVTASGDAGRDAAMFRLAESHFALGNNAAARAGYERLLDEFDQGEFAAAGAYRLGRILLDEGMPEPAARLFSQAASLTDRGGLRLPALYFSARALERLGRDDEAEETYREVVAGDDGNGGNPYRDAASMAMGAVQLRAGKEKSAMTTYASLAASAGDAATASAAALRAGKLAEGLDYHNRALELYELAATKADTGASRSEALLAGLRLRFNQGEDEWIAANGIDLAETIDAPAKAEALRVIAASQRRAGDNKAATSTYEKLSAEDPEALNDPETAYQRLLALYATKDPELVRSADRFLATHRDSDKASQVLLLKAEALYRNGDYADAAKVYGPLARSRSLPAAKRSAALYKHAWCLAASGDHQAAIKAYSDFVEADPNDKLAASAIVQRGISRQKMRDFAGAVTDFDLVVKDYPFSKEVEAALLQKALTSGQQEDYTAMAEAFRTLLEKFPNTAAAAQAHFWLGWSAQENGEYAEAAKLLDKARLLDSENYGSRAALRILLCHYQLGDREAAAREAKDMAPGAVPAAILVWLAEGEAEKSRHAKVLELLTPLAENPDTAPREAWILLAEARLAAGDNAGAVEAADRHLSGASGPPSRARGLVAKAKALTEMMNTTEARKAVDEALLLQPEGPLNAEARLASGGIFFAEADYDSAARAFMSVSVLSDDPVVVPRALKRAAESYRRGGRDDEAESALGELRERFPQATVSP
jgi:tetratricopeptide (TPR) repeat protein